MAPSEPPQGEGDYSKARALPDMCGRTRTGNQTIMSGRLPISFADLLRFRLRSIALLSSVRSFLVQDWCGCQFAVRTVGVRRRALQFNSRASAVRFQSRQSRTSCWIALSLPRPAPGRNRTTKRSG